MTAEYTASVEGCVVTARYGSRRVPKMRDDINTLERLIRQEGTSEIQDAWDAVVQHWTPPA